MTTITTNAAQAYARAAGLGDAAGASAPSDPNAAPGDFASLVQDALGKAIEGGKETELKAAQHIAGKGELVDVVTALTAAETTLDTIVAVRDRVISAYQEISRMPI